MVTAIIVVFILGYIAIALEHPLKINKAATALLIGVLCWTLYVVDVENILPRTLVPTWFTHQMEEEGITDVVKTFALEDQFVKLTSETASILFFLMGAMTIVELVDAHEGFALVTARIRSRNKVKLLWIIGWLSFFMSAVLDNLTTTIVMISLLRKLIHDRPTRMFFVGIVVIAANSGGAWTVIGDVTTTMLWIKQKIGTVEVMQELFIASAISLLIPLLGMSFFIKGDLEPVSHKEVQHVKNLEPWHQGLFLALGLVGLLSVPVFKGVTHLPPYMGIMLSLSVMWIVSELISPTLDDRTRSSTGVLAVLKRVDMSSILFFLGILLAVGALGKSGLLGILAQQLDANIPYREIVATIIGLVSAVVDNVPLVAAGIEMYDLPINDPFWMLLAFCAGTGGSCLIIGSAAGVAAMGMEHIDFIWYMKKISPWALLGYFAGTATYILGRMIFG